MRWALRRDHTPFELMAPSQMTKAVIKCRQGGAKEANRQTTTARKRDRPSSNVRTALIVVLDF